MNKTHNLTILKEALADFHYKIPKDKLKMMMDFYLITSLPPLEWRSDPLKFLVDDVTEEVCKEIRTELLHVSFWAICCEMYHFLSVPQTNKKLKRIVEIMEKIRSYYNPSFTDILRTNERYGAKYKPDALYPDEEKADYIIRNYATNDYLKKEGISKKDFVTMAKEANLIGYWKMDYGNTPWAQICDGWLKLNDAKSTKEQIVWIDHMFDLEHNTGTIFNKLNEYRGRDGGFTWVREALEHKKHANPYHLFPFVTTEIKVISARVMHSVYGTTYQEWLKTTKYDPEELINTHEKDEKDSLYYKAEQEYKKHKHNNLFVSFTMDVNADHNEIIDAGLNFTIKLLTKNISQVVINELLNYGSPSFVLQDAIKEVIYKKLVFTPSSITYSGLATVSLGYLNVHITYNKEDYEEEFNISEELSSFKSFLELADSIDGELGKPVFMYKITNMIITALNSCYNKIAPILSTPPELGSFKDYIDKTKTEGNAEPSDQHNEEKQ